MGKLSLCVKTLVLGICILCIGFAMPIVVHAEDETMIESRMNYISVYSTGLTISESGVASVYGQPRFTCKGEID